MATKCPKCHFENPEDTFYCGKCATPLSSSQDVDISRTKTLETPREELSTGSTFADRYQIIEELGYGGMGRIYRAVDKKLNEEVALKLIRPEIASEKRTLERFHNELKLARKISHPNVGRMYELLEDKGVHFITMEYVPGEDLKSSIRRFGQLPISKSISITKQICEGLAEAHKIGVIHRDLKPSNIMVDKEGNAKVMDFGIARSLKTKGITGEGVSVGTPEYMSPEQVEGEDIDQRSDIYSLGVVLYEMVTGKVPFEGATPLNIALQHKTAEPQNPKVFNAQIPEDLSLLILKCMSKNKEKRCQNAGEVISELNKIESGIPTGVQASERRRPFFQHFLQTLRERKIVETLAAFIGGGWLILEVVHWILIDHYHFPEESLDITIVTLLGVLICTLIWRFYRGVEKKAKKIRIGFILISAILLVTIIFDASIIWKIEKPESKPSREVTQAAHKQLTFVGDAADPAIAPDGKFIAYVTGQEGIEQKVWVQDMVSGRSIDVFGAEKCDILSWTPDGAEITVRAYKDSEFGTFLVPRLGGPPRQIETFPCFAWSPDGSSLAEIGQFRHEDGGIRTYDFISRPDRTGYSFGYTFKNREDITIVNTATGKSSSFNLSGPVDAFKHIDWSPKGDRLLVLTLDKENIYSIWTAKTDGSQQNLVFKDRVPLFSPTWAPGGDAIFYIRGSSPNQKELWKLPVSRDTGKSATTSSLVLSGIPMGEDFTLSDDDRYLLYTRIINFSNLWLARLGGSEKGHTIITKQLTSGTQEDRCSGTDSISPDGKSIAFSRGTGETSNIYVMPTEGGNPTQLTFFNSHNSPPVWSPDGTEIAFVSNEGGESHIWKINVQGGVPFQFENTEPDSGWAILWAPGQSIWYRNKEDSQGHSWYQVLDPKTGKEISLAKDPSEGSIFAPCISPDGNQVAVFLSKAQKGGVWLISTDDFSQKLLLEREREILWLQGWSDDGKWIHALDLETKWGKKEYLMIEVKSGKTKPLPVIPFTIEWQIYDKVIDGKPEICVVEKTLMDVWVIQNFDQIIK